MAGMRHIRYVCRLSVWMHEELSEAVFIYVDEDTLVQGIILYLLCWKHQKKRLFCDVLCVLVQECASPSEPIHAMTCCTSHVLSWTHFTHPPTHPASLPSYSCCEVDREE